MKILIIGTNRIYHRTPMQTEKSQHEGEQIIGNRCLIIFIQTCYVLCIKAISFIFGHFTSHNDLFRTSFGVFWDGAKMT